MPPVKKYYSLIFFMKKICSEKKKQIEILFESKKSPFNV